MEPKQFDFFYDPLDMTTCVEAGMTVRELNQKGADDSIYFPLFLSEDMTIGDLVLGYRFASRSYRFGPLCDNVLGFHFILPGDKKVKVGAQVVKNVTGFDFARFLTNSGSRFGEVERVVLRLRSMAEAFFHRKITGTLEDLEEFRRSLLGGTLKAERRQPEEGAHGEGPRRHRRNPTINPWGQLLDVFDFVREGDEAAYYISFSCKQAQAEIFDRAFEKACSDGGCEFTKVAELPTPSTRPHARVKTLLSKAMGQACKLVDQFGGRAHGFVGNAFFHYDCAPEREADPDLTAALQKLHQEVGALGGHVRCEQLTYPKSTIGAHWEEQLKQKWESLP